MIDIHFHGLPCVDDGPDNQESAINLIKEAYQQGIREIVLTPHMYHPICFGHIPFNEQMQGNQINLFQTFFGQAKKIFPDLVLHEGAEIYISRKYLGQLDQLPIKTIGNTNYILVEFSRRINYHQMDNLLHELHLLGFKPIMAHLEEYSVIYKDLDNIKALHQDNYVIQVNAVNILDAKTENGKRAKQLIELGMIDVVASDSHNLNQRCPQMAKAKTYITRMYGEEIVNQWFVENPTRILNNKSVIKGYKLYNKKQKKILGLCSTFLLIFLMIIALTKRLGTPIFPDQGSLATNEIVSSIPVLADDKSKPIAGTKILPVENHPIEEVPLIEEAPPMGAPAAKMPSVKAHQKEADHPVLGENELTHEEQLIEPYITYLTSLQDSYLQAVDGCYIKFKEVEKIEDKMEQEVAIDEILNEIAKLESQADNKVYKTLYDMQNDLESYEYDIEIIHTTRQHYLDIKIKKSQEYEAKLQN